MRQRIARFLYSTIWYAATPGIVVYLLWRGRRQPEYRRGWSERFLGSVGPRPPGPHVWIHAVSVGETRAAAPLVDALLERHPDRPIVVTHMTPTGRATAEALFGDRVAHAYLPYDYPHAVAAFLRHWRPLVGIVMETEIWPNLMARAASANVPMLLANARLSPKSLAAARRFTAVMQPAARRFDRILAQTDGDARRFAMLTDPTSSIAIVGNMKFDVEPPATQRELALRFDEWVGDRAVFLCASTREGEEEGIVDAWLRHRSGALLVIVPRHPQRFDDVASMARARGLVVQRRSDARAVAAQTTLWLGDSMGELWAYYLAADVAYVGGSVVRLGGQNLIEAAAAGCPVLIGPHTFNFTAASDEAVRVGAATRVDDYDALVVEALEIVGDAPRRRAMGDAGIAFAASHRGATARTITVVDGTVRAWGDRDRISSP